MDPCDCDTAGDVESAEPLDFVAGFVTGFVAGRNCTDGARRVTTVRPKRIGRIRAR